MKKNPHQLNRLKHALLCASALFLLHACGKQKEPAETPVSGDAPASDDTRKIRIEVKLNDIEKLAETDPKLFYVPSLTPQIKRDLIQSQKIIQTWVEVQSEADTAQAKNAQQQSAEQNKKEQARLVLKKHYQSIPQPHSESYEQYGSQRTIQTDRSILQQFQTYFGKVRPEKAINDLKLLSKWVNKKTTDLRAQLPEPAKTKRSSSGPSTRTANKSQPDFGDGELTMFGIKASSGGSNDSKNETPDEPQKNEQNNTSGMSEREQAQIKANVQWLEDYSDNLNRALQATRKKWHIENDPDNYDVASIQTKENASQAWKQFHRKRGFALKRAFRQYERFQQSTPIPVSQNASGGAVIAEVLIEGEPAYFAKGLSPNPVNIQEK